MNIILYILLTILLFLSLFYFQLDRPLRLVYAYGSEIHVSDINEAFKYTRHTMDITLSTEQKSLLSSTSKKSKPTVSKEISIDLEGRDSFNIISPKVNNMKNKISHPKASTTSKPLSSSPTKQTSPSLPKESITTKRTVIEKLKVVSQATVQQTMSQHHVTSTIKSTSTMKSKEAGKIVVSFCWRLGRFYCNFFNFWCYTVIS